jgi:hypothetical protein
MIKPSHEWLVDDLQAHVAGCTFNLAHGIFQVDGVHIFYFDLSDFSHL